jgi:hypothetical protein
VWRTEEKRATGRPTRRWEESVTMDLQEVGWGSTDWIDLDRDRCWALVNALMNHQVS